MLNLEQVDHESKKRSIIDLEAGWPQKDKLVKPYTKRGKRNIEEIVEREIYKEDKILNAGSRSKKNKPRNQIKGKGGNNLLTRFYPKRTNKTKTV